MMNLWQKTEKDIFLNKGAGEMNKQKIIILAVAVLLLLTGCRVCGGFSIIAYQTNFEFCPYCGKKIKVVGD